MHITDKLSKDQFRKPSTYPKGGYKYSKLGILEPSKQKKTK
jgi:hypothetical protein